MEKKTWVEGVRYSKMSVPHLPLLRYGTPYASMEKIELRSLRSLGGGEPLALVSQANAGLIRRDRNRAHAAREALRRLTSDALLTICKKAGELFQNTSLPLGDGGHTQSPEQYVEMVSATNGLPHRLCKQNMSKIHEVFTRMDLILHGLTRGLNHQILDGELSEHANIPLSFYAMTENLGVVLPNNSPGVNSLWMPAIAMKIPVVLKPGRDEPWTPWRIVQAFIAAGCPPEAFSFYPADHEGAQAVLAVCGRSLMFGNERTVAQYAGNPAVQVHGPGRSKVLIGQDEIQRWPELLDCLVASILDNSGRSCINASAIVVPSYAPDIAEALAKRLVEIKALPATDGNALLAAFTNAQSADAVDETITEGLATPGAEDVTAKLRGGARKVTAGGLTYLLPTLIRCNTFSHPLANREFLFPYASIIEVPQENMLQEMGPSLVVTAITRDERFRSQLLNCALIDRLNLGPIPTSHVRWDQPHEGNLFEFLYKRRAIQLAAA